MSTLDAFSLLAAARSTPDAPAIVTGNAVLTYADLAPRVAKTAAWLAKGGIEKPAAIVGALRIETFVALYACFELGVPVVVVHPRTVEEERRRLLAAVGAERILDESWTDAALAADGPPIALARPDEESPLAILFTSGTSGAAKAVHLSRRAFRASAHANAANLGWTPEDRWALCLPVAHVGGLSVVVRCLVARRPIVLAPWTGDLSRLLDEFARSRTTILSFVPTMLAKVFDELPEYRFPDHVRVVLVGGDATPASLLAEAERRGVPVLTTYGLTEACSQVATRAPGTPPSSGIDVGPPLPGVEIRIQQGEIQVRGPMLLTGYYPAGRFPDPFVDGGWLPTGDLGSIDERGRLHVSGRRTDRIITGGENVDPLEVESALLECPGIVGACVFGVPDERWGQVVAAALVVEQHASPPALADIAAHLARTLSSFKRPRVVAFCTELVLNGTGKVDRKATGKAVAGELVALPRAGS